MITDVDLKNCIKKFAESVHDILDGKLQSVYLFGSVVLQDYKDGWSDIDLICFTSEKLSSDEADRLLTLRQALVTSEASPIYRKFEGAVVCIDEFLSNRFSKLVYWGTSGQKISNAYSLDVFSMFELMKYGKLIFGTDIRIQLVLPSYSDLVAGVKQHYDTIRKYAQTTNESIYSCGWLLDISRCLFTLKYGEIISKTEAGEWALEEDICPCISDMKKTLQIRHNPSDYLDLPETKRWLCSLGISVQKYADILEKELNDKSNFLP